MTPIFSAACKPFDNASKQTEFRFVSFWTKQSLILLVNGYESHAVLDVFNEPVQSLWNASLLQGPHGWCLEYAPVMCVLTGLEVHPLWIEIWRWMYALICSRGKAPSISNLLQRISTVAPASLYKWTKGRDSCLFADNRLKLLSAVVNSSFISTINDPNNCICLHRKSR